MEPSSVPPFRGRPSENLGHLKGVDCHSQEMGEQEEGWVRAPGLQGCTLTLTERCLTMVC